MSAGIAKALELRDRLRSLRSEQAKRKAGGSLLEFTKATFPTGFRQNWHHEIMCREIDEWLVAETPYNLALNLPRRHSKSEICSRHLPAYIFGRWPDKHIIAASYGAGLIEGMSRECQKIMTSPEYGDIFPETTISAKGKAWDENAIRRAEEFTIMGRRGHYVCAGVDGPLIGHGGHVGLIDDPIKNRAEAESKSKREGCIEWYRSTFRTSMEQGGRILMLTTRWHVHDLEGHCIRQMEDTEGGDYWKVISFPAIFEDGPYIHPDDPRKPGEALWPWKKSEKELEALRIEGGQYNWASMWQQTPTPAGGNVIKRPWLQIIERVDVPVDLTWVRFWDLAVTEKTKADHTSSGQMAIDENGNIYVRHFINEQQEWPVIRKMMIQQALSEQVAVGVETGSTQKGFFQDLLTIEELRDIPIYGYAPDKSKLLRAQPWIARAQAGKFHVVRGPGVDSYIDELIEFTGMGDEQDNQVDWTSGAYHMFAQDTEVEVDIIGDYEID